MSIHKITSHISGHIVDCEVNVGDKIAEGDTVVMVESMKMEIPIESDRSGKVTELLVNVDDDVAEGQVVVVIS